MNMQKKQDFLKKQIEQKTTHVYDWTGDDLVIYLAEQCAARDWEFSLNPLMISCERFSKQVIAIIDRRNQSFTITADAIDKVITYVTGEDIVNEFERYVEMHGQQYQSLIMELSAWTRVNTEWQLKAKDFLVMTPLDEENALAVVFYPNIKKVCFRWVKHRVLVDKDDKRYYRTGLETYTSVTNFLSKKANSEFNKAQLMFNEFFNEQKDLLKRLENYNIQKSKSPAYPYVVEISNPSFCPLLPYNQNIACRLAITSEWLEIKQLTISFHDIMAPSTNTLTASCPNAYEAEVEILAAISTWKSRYSYFQRISQLIQPLYIGKPALSNFALTVRDQNEAHYYLTVEFKFANNVAWQADVYIRVTFLRNSVAPYQNYTSRQLKSENAASFIKKHFSGAMRWMRQKWIEGIAADSGWLCIEDELYILKVTNPKNNEFVKISLIWKSAMFHNFETLRRTLQKILK